MEIEYTTEMRLALNILNSSGYLWTVVHANNSAPLIEDGDMVYIKRMFGGLAKGDLVAIDSNKMFIIQRIIEEGEQEVTTKADHSEKGPFKIQADKVIGKVILVRKNGEYISINNQVIHQINQIVVSLSIGRSGKNFNKDFFHRKFFHKIRKSLLKRILRLEILIGKRYGKTFNQELQIR